MKKETIIFSNFRKQLIRASNIDELERIEQDFQKYRNSFGIFENDCLKFLEEKKNLLIKGISAKKEISFKCGGIKEVKGVQIDKPSIFRPLEFNLTNISKIEDKINRIKDSKLKFEFQGVFNLLNERGNLVYNELYKRQQVIDDLNKYKSFNFHKVNYVSLNALNNKYSWLSFKNKAIKNYSQIFRINKNLFVLKTVLNDMSTLKAFYTGNAVNVLIRGKKDFNRVPKYNLSSIDAWKHLNEDEIKAFYGFCNKNGLNKENRQILKRLRGNKGRTTFDLYKESLEIDLIQKQEVLEELEENTDNMAENIVLEELEQEILDLTYKLESFYEEKNSDQLKTGNTAIGDYDLYEYC